MCLASFTVSVASVACREIQIIDVDGKGTLSHVRKRKILISLRVRAVRSKSSFFVFTIYISWEFWGVISGDSGQTEQRRRLIIVLQWAYDEIPFLTRHKNKVIDYDDLNSEDPYLTALKEKSGSFGKGFIWQASITFFFFFFFFFFLMFKLTFLVKKIKIRCTAKWINLTHKH